MQVAVVFLFASGDVLFGDFVATTGESVDATFLKKHYRIWINKYGVDRFLGLIQDGASECMAAALAMESEFPKSCNYWCLSHILALLVKDLCALDPVIDWVMKQTRAVVVACNENSEIKRALHAAQVEVYGAVKSVRVGLDVRFATHVLELLDVINSEEALKKLMENEPLVAKYTTSSRSSKNTKAAFSAIPNANFWLAAKSALALLIVICDLIHKIEADAALLSQMRRMLELLYKHVVAWAALHRAAPSCTLNPPAGASCTTWSARSSSATPLPFPPSIAQVDAGLTDFAQSDGQTPRARGRSCWPCR